MDNIKTINPKTGLQCYITDWLTLRGAALKSIKPALVANQTIQPTQVAGFNQFYDDFNGTRAWLLGGGLDFHLAEGLYAGAELSRREVQEPILTDFERHESLYRGYWYWAAHNEWALRGGVEFDFIDFEHFTRFPHRVRTLSVPLGIEYFHPTGLFAAVAATYVQQDVTYGVPSLPEGTESFGVMDAALGYRLPQRRGLMSIEARNLTDKRVKFRDDQFRAPVTDVPALSPFFPERTVLVRVNFSF